MRQRIQAKKQTTPKPLPAPPKSCEKYKKVSPVIDTGPNVRKRQAALELIKQYYHVRADELFRRIKAATLVTLVVEVARLQQEVGSAGPPPPPAHKDADHEKRADLQSLVEGTGELSLSAGDAPAAPAPPSIDDQPYLLLDVRERADFEREHIVTARHYPAARLARTMNYETAEMWRYKRSPDALVVVYDEDEATAQRCATTLAQRGYDNVFILSGGLKVARRKFPQGLLTSGDRDRFTAADIEALSVALDTFYTTIESPRGAASSRSTRSVHSSDLRAARPATKSTTMDGPRWKL
ncbi:centrosomal protein of 41 kDa-like [Amphibalanus amphitrite]|uniref:centrosomal protein of 41 kDa-like n=1 Tax=Amphibalanus amphitrite TaxID=1232801 RepID=UPI001C91EE5E|nr:centrosomal protein of 41 kDa-like [Amphibalanus amphitrite]XP_043229229.1 centrosomal protein of 41 kDa-like [Amphibalanus amphitrite]XP_043229230.1 centrosomal protein of 41 kDa-like [Amphibalanus amphitrite]XP_043229231.1 centrosomal protein of 41 kDa-like [Amphibalanus amphitrite]XP_043229232.1 centrosomal protein of 41 kDa-like [Amphibalanus amphitrite]XP_043229233.1 centrosomal protein of 41 kDa-like [Amphibalanus amphitrite]